jgi:hypothetical protein
MHDLHAGLMSVFRHMAEGPHRGDPHASVDPDTAVVSDKRLLVPLRVVPDAVLEAGWPRPATTIDPCV